LPLDGDERTAGRGAGLLEQGSGEIFVDEPVRAQALGCIERMLDFTAKHPAATAQPAFVKNIGAA
jgi:quinolinate synthase